MHHQRTKQPGNEDPLLCITGDFENVACFDPKTLHLKHEIPTPKWNVRVISIPPEGGREEELIAFGECERDFEVRVLSPVVDAVFRKLSASHSASVDGLAYVSPIFVVSGSCGHPEVVVSDVNRGEKVMDLMDAPEYTLIASSARQEEDGGAPGQGNSFVFVGGGNLDCDKSIRHYDLGRKKGNDRVVRKFKGHKKWARGLAYSTERNLLFSSSTDKTLRIWSVQEGTCLHTLQLSNVSFSLLFDPKKRLIFCGVRGGIIEVWDYRQTSERVRQFNHPTNCHAARLDISNLTQIGDGRYASTYSSVATWTDRGKILATRTCAKPSGQSYYGMCFVGPRSSDALRSDDDDRLAFMLKTCYVLPAESVRVTGFLAGKALLCLSGLQSSWRVCGRPAVFG